MGEGRAGPCWRRHPRMITRAACLMPARRRPPPPTPIAHQVVSAGAGGTAVPAGVIPPPPRSHLRATTTVVSRCAGRPCCGCCRVPYRIAEQRLGRSPQPSGADRRWDGPAGRAEQRWKVADGEGAHWGAQRSRPQARPARTSPPGMARAPRLGLANPSSCVLPPAVRWQGVLGGIEPRGCRSAGRALTGCLLPRPTEGSRWCGVTHSNRLARFGGNNSSRDHSELLLSSSLLGRCDRR